MFSRVRRAVLKLAAVLALLWIACGIVATKIARDALERQRAELQSAFLPHKAEFRKDIELIGRNSPFVARAGGDVSKLMLEHIGLQHWDGNRMTYYGPEPLPPALVSALQSWGADWTEHRDAPELVGLDLSWLKDLSQFGYWEVERRADQRWPKFSDTSLVAKARLLIGLRDGDCLAALEEVRELARLALTTEKFEGIIETRKLGECERVAWNKARNLCLDVASWTPSSEEDAERFKRAWLASTNMRSLVASSSMTTQELGPFQCAALSSGLEEAHFYSLYLERPLRDRYAQLQDELLKSSCRLVEARRRNQQPTDDGRFSVSIRALCPGGPEVIYPSCDFPEVSLAWLPFIRMPLGVLFLSQSHPRSLTQFGGYTHPPPALVPDGGVD